MIRTQDLTQEENITLPLHWALPHALKGFQILHTMRNYHTRFSIAHESSVTSSSNVYKYSPTFNVPYSLHLQSLFNPMFYPREMGVAC